MNAQTRRAILVLIVVNALWGMTFPVMKGLNLQIDQHFGVTEHTATIWLRASSAAWMIGIRFGLALIMFSIVFHRVMARIRMVHVWGGLAIGFFFFSGLLLQVVALGTIPASRSGFLTSMAVVFTPVMATLIRGRLPRTTVMVGVAIAMAGVAVLTEIVVVDRSGVSIASDALQRWTRGDTLTILGALFFSGQIMMVDYLGKRYESIALTPTMFGSVVLMAGVTFAILSPHVPEATGEAAWTSLAISPEFIGLIGLLGIFPSLLAFAWMNKFQPYLSAGQAAVIYTCEPFFASTWAMILPGLMATYCAIGYQNETFSWPLIFGGVLILAANVIALWPQRQPRENHGSAQVSPPTTDA
ncbi:DMT family transporter [Rubripirellula lacrimiformis]|nr:DMT family transporter [Rubripirellula lacrimiformis]